MKRPELYVSTSPHIHSGNSVRKMMIHTTAALCPAVVAGWFFFGWPALQIILVCVVSAVLSEWLWQRVMGCPVRITDGSAAVTGILLGLLLTSESPWWLAALGSFVAIVVGKQLFGGVGNHPFSETLVGWTFLQVSYQDLMEFNPLPEPLFFLGPSEYLAYSPLYTLRDSGVEAVAYVPWLDFLLGNVPGTIGTISVFAVVLGGAYLIYRRIITWHIPVSFILSAWIFALVFHQIDPEIYASPTFHVVSGWMLLGAFFLAPQKGTAPVTASGMIAYGIGCGTITMIIRTWGIYVEGVAFAILLMNAFTPLFDRMRPKAYGRDTEIA